MMIIFGCSTNQKDGGTEMTTTQNDIMFNTYASNSLSSYHRGALWCYNYEFTILD